MECHSSSYVGKLCLAVDKLSGPIKSSNQSSQHERSARLRNLCTGCCFLLSSKVKEHVRIQAHQRLMCTPVHIYLLHCENLLTQVLSLPCMLYITGVKLWPADQILAVG